MSKESGSIALITRSRSIRLMASMPGQNRRLSRYGHSKSHSSLPAFEHDAVSRPFDQRPHSSPTWHSHMSHIWPHISQRSLAGSSSSSHPLTSWITAHLRFSFVIVTVHAASRRKIGAVGPIACLRWRFRSRSDIFVRREIDNRVADIATIISRISAYEGVMK